MVIKNVIFITLLLTYVSTTFILYSQNAVEERKASSTAITWMISQRNLMLIAGEFKGIISDLITLEVASYLGTEVVTLKSGEYIKLKKKIDWDYVERLFRLSMALDPYFVQTYTVSQGYLPWEDAGRVEVQNQLLTIAAESRFWDWRPLHFKAFNTYYFLNDYGKAGVLMLEASKKLNAPYFLSILGGRLALKGGRTETAIMLMKSMLANKKEVDNPEYSAIVKRLKALEGVLLIENALKKYATNFKGGSPDSLDELISTGILSSLPENPYGHKYCLDRDGVIWFDSLDCRKGDD